jgi:ribosomal protein S18 acetylase RimI-like enzyme
MINYPCMIFLFPDAELRERFVNDFAKCRIALLGENSEFWLDKEGKVQGHVSLARVGAGTTEEDRNASGFPNLADKYGDDIMRRFFKALDNCDEEEAAAGEHFDDDYHLGAFAIGPSARGKGIGTRLLSELIARRVKGSRVWLMVLEVPARRLYERLGFKVVRDKPWFLPAGSENAYMRDFMVWGSAPEGSTPSSTPQSQVKRALSM